MKIGRMALWTFARALIKHWWALMGSAVFTFLGIYGAHQGKPSHWIFITSLVVAVLLALVAAFLTWKDQYELTSKLNAKLAVIHKESSISTQEQHRRQVASEKIAKLSKVDKEVLSLHCG